jgi:hypothetical protein
VKLTTHLHLVPRSRMRGGIPPLPRYVFMAWCLVKHRENFTFFTFMDLREVGWESVGWIHLDQDRDQCRDLVSTVVNLRVE